MDVQPAQTEQDTVSVPPVAQPPIESQNVSGVPPATFTNQSQQVAQPPEQNHGAAMKWFWILVAVLLAIIIPVALYYAASVQNSSTPPPTSRKPVVLPTAAPSPTPNPFDTWETYIAPNFTFQHPQSMEIKQSPKNFFTLIPDKNAPAEVDLPQISIDSRLTKDYAKYDTAVTATKKNLINVQTVNRLSGEKISGVVALGSGAGQSSTTVLFKYKLGAIAIQTSASQEAALKIFDHLVSTFRLTNATPSAPTAKPTR